MLHKQLKIKDQTIAYVLNKSSRAKRLRITIGQDAQLKVTLPRFVSEYKAEKFLQQKADWILKAINYYQTQTISLNQTNLSMKFEDHKDRAKEFLSQRVEYVNQNYGFEYNRITVRNHSRKWGSCSSKKNINFNYRLLFLPVELVDYVVAHELCHLKHMNHSPDFWAEVSKTIPDYKRYKLQLKRIVF